MKMNCIFSKKFISFLVIVMDATEMTFPT